MLLVSGTSLVLASWAFVIALILALGAGPAIALAQGAGSGVGKVTWGGGNVIPGGTTRPGGAGRGACSGLIAGALISGRALPSISFLTIEV